MSVIWYGYEFSFSQIKPVAVKKHPNGSNAYYFDPRTEDEKEKLRDFIRVNKSHSIVRFEYTDFELSTRTPYELTPLLVEKVNRVIMGPHSSQTLIEDMAYHLDTEKMIHTFTAVYPDGDPVTVPKNILLQILDTEGAEGGGTEGAGGDTNSDEINIFYDEALIASLSIPFKVSDIEAEFVAKSLFVFNAYYNQFLRPYANRIGWKSVNGIGTVNLPLWTSEDMDSYSDNLADDFFDLDNLLVLGTPNRPGSIKLSDGKWYLLPEEVPFDEGATIPTSKDKFTYNGKEYFSSGIIYQVDTENNLYTKSISRVNLELSEGLLPFENYYPEIYYPDADDRISVIKDEAGIAVYTNPDKYILGTYSSDVSLDKIKSRYSDLWSRGSFLTNGGHANYKDSMSPIDYGFIRKIDVLL